MSKPASPPGAGQPAAMTPQRQQALRLLQLPSPLLQARIQHALESNVMLAADEEFDATWALDPQADTDTPWFPGGMATTLHEHLARQLVRAPLPNGPCTIGRALIDAIGDDGYLAESPQAVAASVAGTVRAEAAVVESVLAIIQQFEPAGAGARSVSECIDLQLAQLDPATPGRDAGRRIARGHLEMADNRQLSDLQRLTGCGGAEVELALALIRSCERRPGAAFQSQPALYVVPDVFARLRADQWTTELNAVATPRLRVNERYAASVTRSADHAMLRVQLQEARWLVESLELRNEAVLRIASAIVDRQQDFLGRRADSMRPIPPDEIADAVALPESTVPPATAGKYLHTPRGVFEFRFFVSDALPRTSGVAA